MATIDSTGLECLFQRKTLLQVQSNHGFIDTGALGSLDADQFVLLVPYRHTAVGVGAHGHAAIRGLCHEFLHHSGTARGRGGGKVHITTHLGQLHHILEVVSGVGGTEGLDRDIGLFQNLKDLLEALLAGTHVDVYHTRLVADQTSHTGSRCQLGELLAGDAGIAVVRDADLDADDLVDQGDIPSNRPVMVGEG